MSEYEFQPITRPSNPFMEEQVGKVHKALDHGFVRLIDYMGDEAAIVQAARVSFGEGSKGPAQDRNLLRYLMRHKHTTPMEMCEIKLHCAMPIFVARQWIRHRTANVNEYSGRYSKMRQEFYVPEPEHLGVQSQINAQGRGDMISPAQAQQVIDLLTDQGYDQWACYETLLNADENGSKIMADQPQLAKELSRMGLGLNYYTQWYWKIDLHNLLHFLSLRAHRHAQYEIRVFADIISGLVAGWLPNVWAAFEDYHPHRSAHTFSGPELKLVRDIAQNRVVLQRIPGTGDLFAVIYNDPSPDGSVGALGETIPAKRLFDRYGLGSTRERKAFVEALGL